MLPGMSISQMDLERMKGKDDNQEVFKWQNGS